MAWLTFSPPFTPAPYAEELAWWQAAGWQLVVEVLAEGDLRLHCHWPGRRPRSGGASASATQAATVAGVRHFLTQTLYAQLHPARARRAQAATGQVCSPEQLERFIYEHRRLAALPRQR